MNFMLRRHPRYRAPALVFALLGAALSATTWFVAAGWEDRIAKAELNLRANNIGAVLQNNVNGSLSKISPALHRGHAPKGERGEGG